LRRAPRAHRTKGLSRLNADAAAVVCAARLRGGTDVTGYGLIGHLHEMALSAGVAARIRSAAVPLVAGVAELVERGCAPDGSRRTLANALERGWFDPGTLDATGQLLLADAQTSGGLLLAVPPEQADSVVAQLHERGDGAATVVGELVSGEPGAVSTSAPADEHSGLRHRPVPAGAPAASGAVRDRAVRRGSPDRGDHQSRCPACRTDLGASAPTVG
jgi:selenide,water dikinase